MTSKITANKIALSPRPSNLFISVLFSANYQGFSHSGSSPSEVFLYSLFPAGLFSTSWTILWCFRGKWEYKIPLTSSGCILGSLLRCNIWEASWKHLSDLDVTTTYSGSFQRPLFLANVQQGSISNWIKKLYHCVSSSSLKIIHSPQNCFLLY